MLASKIFTRTRLMGAKIHYLLTILLYRVTELHMKKKLLPLSLSLFFYFLRSLISACYVSPSRYYIREYNIFTIIHICTYYHIVII